MIWLRGFRTEWRWMRHWFAWCPPLAHRLSPARRTARYLPTRRAKARCYWWIHVLGHEYEICMVCGRGYELWWCEDDALYAEVTDAPGMQGVTCIIYGGTFCPRCFDDMAESKGITIEWRPRVVSDAAGVRYPAIYHGMVYP